MLKYFLLFISAAFITATSLAQNNGTVKFNNVPFTNGTEAGKTSFKSNEFIYGRVELGKPVKEDFKVVEPDELTNPYVLIFRFKIEFTDKSGKRYVDDSDYGDFVYVKPEDLSKTYINIDVLPDPALASNIFCMVSNFKGGHFSCPVYNVGFNQYQNNSVVNYRIQIVGGTNVRNNSKNPEMPSVSGDFSITINHADYEKYKQNGDLSDKKIAAEGMNLSNLPPIFSKPFKTTDPKLTAAKLSAILKRDYPHRKVLKMALDSDGGQLWLIAKNDFGIPRYRYFNGILQIAYQEDGVCKVGKVELIENYLGGGKYGQLTADYPSGYDRKINCAAVK